MRLRTGITRTLATAVVLHVVSSGTCLAEGRDIVSSGGFAALVPSSSHASLTAFLRKVKLSSGEQWAIDLYGDRLIGFGVEKESIATDQVDNGAVQLSVNDAKTILASAVNLTGVAQSTASHMDGSTVVLDPATDLPRQTFLRATTVHPHLSAMLKSFRLRKVKLQTLPPVKTPVSRPASMAGKSSG